jgi:hypothetical protein
VCAISPCHVRLQSSLQSAIVVTESRWTKSTYTLGVHSHELRRLVSSSEATRFWDHSPTCELATSLGGKRKQWERRGKLVHCRLNYSQKLVFYFTFCFTEVSRESPTFFGINMKIKTHGFTLCDICWYFISLASCSCHTEGIIYGLPHKLIEQFFLPYPLNDFVVNFLFSVFFNKIEWYPLTSVFDPWPRWSNLIDLGVFVLNFHYFFGLAFRRLNN